MKKEQRTRFWQAAWWRENRERGLWGATIALIVLLMAVTVYATPELKENIFPSPETQDSGEVTPETLQTDTKPVANPETAGETQPEGESGTESGSETEALPVVAEAQESDAGPEAQTEETGEISSDIDMEALLSQITLTMPLASCEFTRGYGYDYNPNTNDYRFHRGCDLAAAQNSPVFAMAAGVVLEAFEDDYWGGVVELDHGAGWVSIYRCLDPQVSAGEQVPAGATLGYVILAPAESVQESHLHLEVENNGNSYDPALFLVP